VHQGHVCPTICAVHWLRGMCVKHADLLSACLQVLLPILVIAAAVLLPKYLKA